MSTTGTHNESTLIFIMGFWYHLYTLSIVLSIQLSVVVFDTSFHFQGIIFEIFGTLVGIGIFTAFYVTMVAEEDNCIDNRRIVNKTNSKVEGGHRTLQ